MDNQEQNQEMTQKKMESEFRPGWTKGHKEYLKERRKALERKDPSRYPIERNFQDACLSKLVDFDQKEINQIYQWTKNPKNFLIFMGDPGIGKTYLAVALYNRWWYEGEDVVYREFPSIFTTMQYDIKEGKHQDNEVVRCVEADILILNDFGATKKSEWVVSQTYKIIDGRYQSQKPTLITTNLSEKGINEYFEERIASRLMGNSNIHLQKWGKGLDKRKQGM